MAKLLPEMMLVPGMTHDLGGGFRIRRLLPFRQKRMVGPFIFFDHMGPVEFVPSAATDIRPHPHIGLSTLTYLYEGRMVHRDSLGSVQTILPGEVNWMTSGKGIVHSERAHPEDYRKNVRMQGLQFWVALPDHLEDIEPSFEHYSQDQLPVHRGVRFTATVIAGKAFGLVSPVKVSSPTLFVDIRASTGAEMELDPAGPNFEIAVYVLTGKLVHRTGVIEEGQLAILRDPSDLKVKVETDAHFVVIGGEAFKKPRFIWWNFVSSIREKIQAAKSAWKLDTFPKIPGETERIPLNE